MSCIFRRRLQVVFALATAVSLTVLATNSDGFAYSPLHCELSADIDVQFACAAKDGNSKALKTLIYQGADIHNNNDRPLRLAVLYGQHSSTETLLRNGANVHVNHDELIVAAAEEGDAAMVRILLDFGADVHARKDEALTRAAQEGHYNVVATLLDNGANIHAGDDLALRAAVLGNRIDTIKLLLDRGASIQQFIESVQLRREAIKNHSAAWQLLRPKLEARMRSALPKIYELN